MRLFVAINFSEETIKRLASLRDELRGNSRGGIFTLTENLHLTLAFIDECSDKQTASVRSVIEEVKYEPFDIAINQTGRFKRDRGDTWWVGLGECKPLLKLQIDLFNKLTATGFDLDKRDYSPHITIGRRVSTSMKPRNIDPIGVKVLYIDLMKSERISGKLTYTVISKEKCSDV